jgi:hypothetical protein
MQQQVERASTHSVDRGEHAQDAGPASRLICCSLMHMHSTNKQYVRAKKLGTRRVTRVTSERAIQRVIDSRL